MSSDPDLLNPFEGYEVEEFSDPSEEDAFFQEFAPEPPQTKTAFTAEPRTRDPYGVDIPGLTVGELPKKSYGLLPTIEQQLQNPLVLDEAKTGSTKSASEKFLTAGKDTRAKIFVTGNLTLQNLKTQQARPIFAKIQTMLENQTEAQVFEKLPTLMYVLKSEEGLLTKNAVDSLKYLNLIHRNEALDIEERNKAGRLHNQILETVRQKSNEISSTQDQALSLYQKRMGAPITIGKEDELEEAVFTVLDLIDAPDRFAFSVATDLEYDEAAADKRFQYLKELAKSNLGRGGYNMRNPLASMFMAASDLLGKGAGLALTAGIESFKLLEDLAIEGGLESGFKPGFSAIGREPKDVRKAKPSIDPHQKLMEGFQTYTVASRGMTELISILLTSPTTYLSGGTAGVPKILSKLDEVLEFGYRGRNMKFARPFTEAEKESIRFQVQGAIEDSYRSKSALVTDELLLDPAQVNKHVLYERITQNQARKKIIQDIESAKRELSSAMKAEQRNVFGARAKTKRAQVKLDELNARYNLNATKAQQTKANAQSYLDFEDKVSDTVRLPEAGSVLTDELGVTALKTQEGTRLVSNLYADIADIAQRNGVNMKEIERFYGKGGEFLGKSELSFMGKPMRVPGAGPYFFHRSLRKLAPKFKGLPRLSRALEQSGSEFAEIRPTGSTLLTAEGGVLKRMARARKEVLQTTATNTANDLFSRASVRLVANDEFQDFMLTRKLDSNFSIHDADGLMFDSVRYMEDIPPPIQGRGDPEFYSVPITEERQLSVLEPVVSRTVRRREQGKVVERQVTDFPVEDARVRLPPGIEPRPAGLPASMPEARRATKKKKGMLKYRPGMVRPQETNMVDYRSLLDIVADPDVPVKIMSIGTKAEDVLEGAKLGKAGKSTIQNLRRDSTMNGAIESLSERIVELKAIKKADAEKGTNLLDEESLFISVKPTEITEETAALPPSIYQVKIGDLKKLRFRNVDFEDLGAAWNTPAAPGQYINREWLAGAEDADMFVPRLDPVIEEDVLGQAYFVRHMPSAEDALFEMTEQEAIWAKGFYEFMRDFREEFVASKVFTEDQAAFNPITGFYIPRDYAKRKFSEVTESVMTDDPFSSGRYSIEKSRIPGFGVPLGDTGRLANVDQAGADILLPGARKIDPDLNIPRITTNYIRKASTKLARHDLTEAYAKLYGVPKKRFMETFKETYDGRGSPILVTDARVGTRMEFKKGATAKEALVKLEDDVLFNVETKPNEVWNMILREARDKSGKVKPNSRFKVYDGVDDQYVFPAAVANEIAEFADTSSYLSKLIDKATGKDDAVGTAARAVLYGVKSTDRAVKRGILMSRPAYFAINMLTDTMMLMARIPNITLKDFELAIKLLDNPEALKIPIAGLDITIPGQKALAAGRKQGLMLSSIDRLEDLSGAVNPATKLKIAALRGNGVGFSFAGKNEFLLSVMSQQKKFADLGLKTGENFVAWWQDFHQAAGYIAALRSGSSYTEAASRVFKATLDYGDRTKALNTLRIIAPFATWAVKAPKSTLAAYARRPRAFTIPVRMRETLENVTIEEEGQNYRLPTWMREQGNYFRVPKAFAPYINIAEKLLGGEGINDDEQLFVKTRMSPLFEAVQPFFTSLSVGTMNPFVMQLNPGLKALYEFTTNINTLTGQPYAEPAQLSRPFAEGTPFPRKYFLFGPPIPRAGDPEAGFSPLGETAMSPEQMGYASQHLLPYLGALPEVVPFQRFAVSAMGLQLANIAQFYGQNQQTPPFMYGQTRPFTGSQSGRTALSRSLTGSLTGYTPAYVSPTTDLTALMNIGDRARTLEQLDTAQKRMRKALQTAFKEYTRDKLENKTGKKL